MPDSADIPRPSRRSLGRAERLTRSGLFAEAYRQERRRAGRCMVVWLRHGDGAALRLGVVASRRVGGAVERNRARRRLREVYRRHRHRLQGDADVVLVARRGALTASFAGLEEEMLDLLRRLGIQVAEETAGRGGGETP